MSEKDLHRSSSTGDDSPSSAVGGPAKVPAPGPFTAFDCNTSTVTPQQGAPDEPRADCPATTVRLPLLPDFEILQPLGRGGMGQVYKARHVRLDRVVALKIIRKEVLEDPSSVRRFQREAKAVARLSHPNIVTLYDANQVGDTHFLVMEYVEGTDLSRLVKERGPLPVAEACECVRQAALGLQHAHERGLVHRDIKPANLLLTTQGSAVKILDLGLARLDHLSQEGTISQEATPAGPC